MSTDLHVGQHVNRGELLVELDSTPQQLQLREEQTQLQGIEPQLSRLRSQIDAENRMYGEEQQSSRLSGDEAASRRREADTRAHSRELELARMRNLYAQHLVSTREFEKAESDARQLRLAVNTSKRPRAEFRRTRRPGP